MPAADLDLLCDILMKVGTIGMENDLIQEIDINPLILSGAKPVAVDALIVLKPTNEYKPL
jgi:succinyl-CoA synthetase beta subunit